MDRATFACPGPLCDGSRWTVARAEGADGLWQIAASPADSGFLVAAPQPICPRCGERLLLAPELSAAPHAERRRGVAA